mgnify:CR=1 FL=1
MFLFVILPKIEKGTMNTSFEILHTLVTCLGTSLDVLLYPDLPMEQQEVAKLVGCYKACPPGERGLIMKTVQCLANELIERKQKEVAHLGPTWPEAHRIEKEREKPERFFLSKRFLIYLLPIRRS